MNRDMIHKIQHAISMLEEANRMLEDVDGFADYTQHIEVAIGDLTIELEELVNFGVK